MNEFEEVPETYQADNEDFNELYVLAWALIVAALFKLVQMPQQPTATRLLQMERQVVSEVSAIFSDLNRQAVNMATRKVEEAYTEGYQYSREALSQENKTIDAKEEMNDSHKNKMAALITQTQDDLLKATHNTENNVKQLVRKVVSREISGTGQAGRIGKTSNMAKRVEQQLREQFLQNGIKDADVAIIDKANRKWKLQTYSSMVTRTKMNVAYIEAIREEAAQDGSDLAIISTKPDTYDACLHYEGMIISLNGVTSGYLTYDEIRASKQCFHPNCGHFVRPVGGIDWIPKNLQEIHKKKMKRYREES
jgi:Phage minor capsid protein 2